MQARGSMTLTVAASLMALAPSAASASTCDVEPPGYLLPPPGAPAPRNVRPIVRLPIGGGTEPCRYPLCAGDVVSLELRTSPGTHRLPSTIALDVTEARGGAVVTYAMKPRVLLDASRRYEVFAVMRPRAGHAAGARRLLGSLRTGGAVDRIAPTWEGMQPIAVFPWDPPGSPEELKKRKRTIVTSDPQPMRTYADVWGRPAVDGETPPDAMSYAVRVQGDDGQLDPTSMPRGFFRGEIDLAPDDRVGGHLFWLGQRNSCFAHTFDFPSSGKLTIGVTAVDLAGNESPMLVQTLDLDAR